MLFVQIGKSADVKVYDVLVLYEPDSKKTRAVLGAVSHRQSLASDDILIQRLMTRTSSMGTSRLENQDTPISVAEYYPNLWAIRADHKESTIRAIEVVWNCLQSENPLNTLAGGSPLASLIELLHHVPCPAPEEQTAETTEQDSPDKDYPYDLYHMEIDLGTEERYLKRMERLYLWLQTERWTIDHWTVPVYAVNTIVQYAVLRRIH